MNCCVFLGCNVGGSRRDCRSVNLVLQLYINGGIRFRVLTDVIRINYNHFLVASFICCVVFAHFSFSVKLPFEIVHY